MTERRGFSRGAKLTWGLRGRSTMPPHSTNRVHGTRICKGCGQNCSIAASTFMLAPDCAGSGEIMTRTQGGTRAPGSKEARSLNVTQSKEPPTTGRARFPSPLCHWKLRHRREVARTCHIFVGSRSTTASRRGPKKSRNAPLQNPKLSHTNPPKPVRINPPSRSWDLQFSVK